VSLLIMCIVTDDRRLFREQLLCGSPTFTLSSSKLVFGSKFASKTGELPGSYRGSDVEQLDKVEGLSDLVQPGTVDMVSWSVILGLHHLGPSSLIHETCSPAPARVGRDKWSLMLLGNLMLLSNPFFLGDFVHFPFRLCSVAMEADLKGPLLLSPSALPGVASCASCRSLKGAVELRGVSDTFVVLLSLQNSANTEEGEGLTSTLAKVKSALFAPWSSKHMLLEIAGLGKANLDLTAQKGFHYQSPFWVRCQAGKTESTTFAWDQLRPFFSVPCGYPLFVVEIFGLFICKWIRNKRGSRNTRAKQKYTARLTKCGLTNRLPHSHDSRVRLTNNAKVRVRK